MLAALLNFSLEDNERDFFAVHNMDSHRLIADTLQRKYGVTVPLFPIQVLPPTNYHEWLSQHAQMHNVFSQLLGLESNNFNISDFKSQEEIEAFAQQHFQNHADAHNKLGIPQ